MVRVPACQAGWCGFDSRRQRMTEEEKKMPGSNLTAPRINWGWVIRGMTTSWKFEGQGSRKARTMEMIQERSR